MSARSIGRLIDGAHAPSACGSLGIPPALFRIKERAGCPRTADKNVGAPAKVLEPVKLLGVEGLKSFRRTLYMTRNKLTLIVGLILGAVLLAGTVVYAQTFDSPFVATQEPGSNAQTFAFFMDGAFLGVATEDITKENMSRYGLREVRGVGVTEVI